MTQVNEKDTPKVLIPCRRGNDQITRGQRCESKSAYRLSPEGSKAPAFKCVKCGFEWIVPVGGQFTGA